MDLWHVLSEDFTRFIIIYCLLMLAMYLGIALFSIKANRDYIRKLYFTNYRVLASSELSPWVSVVAPVYNEGANVFENVRSLLCLHYEHMELIIVNDGSKDDTMARLIKGFDLEETEEGLQNLPLRCKSIKGVYRSRNPVYRKLRVIDKVNGGKSDALNAGINLANHRYIVSIDGDCILEQDAILKLVKPFLEATNKRVIATGGVIRIANSCEVYDGKLAKVHLPKNFLARAQVLEYLRAFLLGRMAWSHLDGLLLISGAFGAFDREILIASGGYSHDTVGEDMELVVRMRRYMADRKMPYKVAFIPDPLCWTEAPASYKILGRQRNRWARGTAETLWRHRRMFFNPRYGILGVLSFPYWFFFEFLAPVVEFLGLLVFVFLLNMGWINWPLFWALLAFTFSLGFLFSVFAIVMEASTFDQYRERGDLRKLLLTALIEPFCFHPFVVWSAVRGYIHLFRKERVWGDMARQGFTAAGKRAKAA